MAATVPVESAGAGNPLLEQAALIGQVQDADDRVEASKPQPVNEPSNGSFERFLGSFGNPARWAGH